MIYSYINGKYSPSTYNWCIKFISGSVNVLNKGEVNLLFQYKFIIRSDTSINIFVYGIFTPLKI